MNAPTTQNTTKTLAQQAAEDQPRDGAIDRIATWVEGSQEGNPTAFRHVHAQWLKQCQPIDTMLDVLQTAEQECTDLLIDPREVYFDGNKVLIDNQHYDCTEHGLNMLANWYGVPRAAARQLAGENGHPHLFEQYFTWRRSELPTPKHHLKIRLRGTTIRAVFSEKYREISNAWLMETFHRIIPEGLVSHFRGDGDTMSGNILIPDTIRTETDSDYGGGIGFRHSEIGVFRIQVLPFVFRAICCNGCVWGKREGALLRKVHLGDDVNEADLFERIAATINAQIPLVPNYINRIQRLKEIPFQSGVEVVRVIHHLSQTPRITKDQSRAWLDGYRAEGGDTNAFGIVQGLTRSVRRDSTDAGSRLEEFAGDLIDRPANWWYATGVACTDTPAEELVKHFGEALDGLLT